ncbi:MAG: hypothetical protein ACYC5N_05555 [Endomicrobiales bacterium]
MPAKTVSRKGVAKRETRKKQQKLECGDCGLLLAVDEMCGCSDLSGVVCCGKPMKQKK